MYTATGEIGMNLLIIIKKDKFINQTLSTIKFNQFGETIDNEYIICNTWAEGFSKAKTLNYSHGLFVNGGTVFTNIDKFIEDLENYPHQGLIGHLIDPLQPDKFFYLDQQCFVLDLNKFDSTDFNIGDFESAPAERSDVNLHDNYTPLWLKQQTTNSIKWTGTEFGQQIIAKQLRSGIAVNFNNKLRDNKKYLYTENEYDLWVYQQSEYTNIAESQLWIFNNETIPNADTNILLAPASGLCWIKNLVNDTVQQIDLVDISKIQMQLAKELWDHWDGIDYGTFVGDFMSTHSVIHFNLDQPTMTDMYRLKLKSRKFLIEQINQIFQKYINQIDFPQKWQDAKKHKKIKFHYADLIKFLPNYVADATQEFNLWSSNILDYKYTLVKNLNSDYEKFNQALRDPKVKIIYGQK